MLVNDPSFSERKQREQLSTLTGLTGERLDTLYKDIGKAIYKPISESYKQSIF